MSSCHPWGEIMPHGVTSVANLSPWTIRPWWGPCKPDGDEVVSLRLLFRPAAALAERRSNAGAASYAGNSILYLLYSLRWRRGDRHVRLPYCCCANVKGVLNLALALVRRRYGRDHLCRISLCASVSVKLCFSAYCLTA